MCWVSLSITSACQTISKNYVTFTLGTLVGLIDEYYHLGLDKSNLLHYSKQIDLTTLEHLIRRAHKIVAIMCGVFTATLATQEETMRAGAKAFVS
jgi:hypothetical protein